jgi:hypothetical protein
MATDNSRSWKKSKDPLYRGDAKDGVRSPHPSASASIVRHVLQLEGPGTETPFLSTSEEKDYAQEFAGRNGRVWTALAWKAEAAGAAHRPRKELLQLLRSGAGDAAWPSASERQEARKRVEQWA